MNYRVTFVEGGYSAVGKFFSMYPDRTIMGIPRVNSGPRMEVRGIDGEIIRIGSGGDFTLIESPLGTVPLLYGEVFGLTRGHHKYRTSCWCLPPPYSAGISYFVRPVVGESADEYFAITGDLIISEFDDNGRPYIITPVPEGSSVIVRYQPPVDGRVIYSSDNTTPIKDADYDYIIANYIDPRRWSQLSQSSRP